MAVVGKPRSYETDDGNLNVSLRPEHISVVDAQTRNRWVADTASQTLGRIEAFDEDSNPYARMATEQYGDTIDQYRQIVIDALESLDSTSTEVEMESETPTTPQATDTAGESAEAAGTTGNAEPPETTTTDTESVSPQSDSVSSDTDSDTDGLGEFDDNI